MMDVNVTHLLYILIIVFQVTIGIVYTEDKVKPSSPVIPKTTQLSPPSKDQVELPPSVPKTLLQDKLCNSSPNFDATLFDHSIWNHVEVKSVRGSDPHAVYREEYHFSFCHLLGTHNSSSIPPNCSNYHICHVIHNGTDEPIINGYKDLTYHTSINGLTYAVIGGDNVTTCPGVNVSTKPHVHLSFTCDRKHGLGRPIKKMSQPCNAQFTWPTTVACNQVPTKDVNVSKNILSKCYTYDNNGDIRDLSPLIVEDGYEVLTMPEINSTISQKKYFINVCSEVGKSCKNHQSGSAACARRSGEKSYRDDIQHLGLVRLSTLHYDQLSEEVVLTYQDLSSTNEYKCRHQTHIRFKCPKQSHDVNIYGLESRKPFLISSSECETVIEWETDHACPVHKLRGNMTTCIIEEGDFKIDLGPLKSKGSIVVKNITGEGLKPGVKYDAVMRICDAFGDVKICGDLWASNSVCLNSSNSLTVIGTKNKGSTESELSYNDGKVTLVYPTNSHHNDLCPDKDASPLTSLNFICDETTEAEVKHVSTSPTCEFDFDVRTKYACHPPHLTAPLCSLEYNGTVFDLSPLRKKANEFLWTASVNPHNFNSAYVLSKDERIWINVCGAIPKFIKNNGTCDNGPPNTAACLHNIVTKESTNIGEFVTPPVYDPESKSIRMTYETSDVKKKRTVSSFIFKCSPGNLDSSPVLTSHSDTKALETFTFEWKTSVACPLKTSFGENCTVVDESLGYEFDLTPLRREHPYIVRNGGYDYHLNVCGKLLYNPCSYQDVNAGICQRDTKYNTTYVTGQFNSNLTYYDGVLKLTYYNGSKYLVPNNDTPRTSEIVFICDEEDDDVDVINKEPKLEHVGESNRTYFFRWYTKYACPDTTNMVPCLWTNGTHSLDLSPMSLFTGNHFAVTGVKRSAGSRHDRFFANICRPLNPIRGTGCPKGSAMCWQAVDSHGVTKTTSLGVPTYPPAFHDGHNLSIIYTNGDPCYDPEDKTNKTYSSWINFICDSTDDDIQGSFEPIEHGACHKKFQWKTNLVCDLLPEVDNFHTTVRPSTSKTTKVPSKSDAGGSERKNSKPGTAGIVVITVISFLIVLFAIFLIVNTEARNIMLFRVRSLVCGSGSGPSRSMYYSQLTTNDFNTSADQVAFISGHSSLSPYNTTTTSMYNPSRNSSSTPLKNGNNGKTSQRERHESIGVPFPMYDDDDIDLLT